MPQVSNGDMAEAVAFLTEKNAKVPQQQDETTYYQTSQVASDRYISVGSQADTSEQLPSFAWSSRGMFDMWKETWLGFRADVLDPYFSKYN